MADTHSAQRVPHPIPPHIGDLPKAELHLHLEGAIAPGTTCELAARHGVRVTELEVVEHYRYADFLGFLEAFKWVTSFLRTPEDFALVTERLCQELIAQKVVYAEVTLSVGVMLWRKQDPLGNFAAVCEVAQRFRRQGLQLQWIFDAVRQFGPSQAMEVARLAAAAKSQGVAAFGLGGDELSRPAHQFRQVYDFVAAQGIHRLVHAGEVGGPEEIRAAIDILGAERIGHGIAAIRDEALLDFLAESRIPLEICPTSNLCTGALARQLGRSTARIEDHPLPEFYRRGVLVLLSTDDPAMFHTSLNQEYQAAANMGLSEAQLKTIAGMSFSQAFLAPSDQERYRPYQPRDQSR
jgi:adenosine deaminase/aminodeoxyfutalosine deaminase